jgi:predicted chitinase
MAEKVEIDIPGIGLIEAKNAASEATLLEILDVMKGTQKAVQQQAKGKPGANQGGGSGSKEAKEGAENQSKLNRANKDGIGAAKTFAAAGKLAGSSFKLVGQSAHLAAHSISGLAAGAGAAAGAIVGLTRNTMELGAKFAETLQTMANVGDSTTAAAGAMRMIPLVGGPLAGAFSAVAGAVEGSVKSYQTAASVGATFNGSVNDMSRAASGAGMTLDQFANLIKSNAENLIYLGGTTEAGAKQFAGLAKEIQGSGAGAELQRLGFTTEQINGGMAKYIGILGKTGAIQGMTTSQIAAASGSYLKELDALAKITGQSREEKQKEQDALMRDAQVRAAMAGMDAESQKQMMNYITSFPKEQQAAIKDMIATGNVTSEEAIKLQSMLPGVAEQTMQFGRTMQAGGKINAEQMNSARNNAIREAKDSVMRNKARGMYDKEAGEAYVGAANLASMEIDGLSKAMGEQGKATKNANLAENLTKAKQRLAEFSNGFQQALANPAMLDMLMKSFETLASFVQQIIVPAFNIFAQILSAVIPVVTNLLMPAFKALGEFMQSTVIPAFNILGMWVRDAIVPIFKQAWSIISETVGSFTRMLGITSDVGDGLGVFEEILYDISYFIEDNLQPILLGFGVLIGTVLVAKLVAWGAGVLASLAPLGSFVVGLASATFSLMKTAVSVGIAAVQFVASLTMMAGRAIMASLAFLGISAPVALFVAGIAAGIFIFKKLGGDMQIFADAIKWAGSWVNTLFLKLQMGIYSLLNKIPGMRGDFDADIKGIGEKLEENEKNRAKLEDDMAKRRQANLDQQKADEAKALADKKKAEADAAAAKTQGDASASARDEKAAKRDEERRARAARREQDAIKNKEAAELGAIGAKEEREKAAAEEAKGVTVDKSDPIQMLKTFASQQKSAFTQEAKALDDKAKTESELALANQEMIKAKEQSDKATNDLERKAAVERIKAAAERLGKATKADKEADDVVKKAAERMTQAKQGKDPGAVAAGKPKEEKTETAKAPEATGKPTSEAKVPPINQDVQKNLELVKAALQKQGLTDPKYIAATLGNVMKETGGKSISENMDYSKTSNERIKKIFGSRAAGKTDQELDTIKKDPKQMGEMMYGSGTKMGQQMGNTEPGDGWKYRGRGFIQLTGKSNYSAASKAIYGDNRLVDNPDLVNDPAVAAEVSAWYMKKGQARMATSLGVDTKNMTQDQANLLATSQIAGGDIRKKGAIGQELSGKVDKFASSGQIQAIAGAPVSEGKPKPQDSKTETKPEDAAKARADAAANDPRRTDKSVAQAETKKEEAMQTPAGAMQSLIKDGIVPTTIAFQDLIKKGIMPMLTGTQVKGLDKGTVKPEDSLKPGEELMKSLPKVAETMMAQNKTRGTFDTDAGKSLMATAKNMSASTSFETPKTEIIAQAEKAAAEKAAELEKQQAEFREKLKQEEAMAMSGPSSQEGPLSGSSDLNTALAELIAISKRTADLNEKQLSVQSSLSGDLFA